MDQAGGLTLRVLGELDAIRDGAVIDLGGRRQRAALAALIIARGDVVSAETLAACVWGDEAGDRGAGGLHSYVSHLRRRLQPDAGTRSRTEVITRIGRGYALSAGSLAVDAWRFEHSLAEVAELAPFERARQLTAALGLWRGLAYAEYADEPWAETEIARLTELRAVARERQLEARLAHGDSPMLVADAEALVAEDPLREDRWSLLVLALYRAQRQGDALVALRRARRTLASELGVEPGPGLRSLERDVLAQSPALDGPARMRQSASAGSS